MHCSPVLHKPMCFDWSNQTSIRVLIFRVERRNPHITRFAAEIVFNSKKYNDRRYQLNSYILQKNKHKKLNSEGNRSEKAFKRHKLKTWKPDAIRKLFSVIPFKCYEEPWPWTIFWVVLKLLLCFLNIWMDFFSGGGIPRQVGKQPLPKSKQI